MENKTISIELPLGDERKIDIWHVEEKHNSIKICVSIEHKYKQALEKIANLSMAKISDYKHGYKKCRKIAQKALKNEKS